MTWDIGPHKTHAQAKIIKRPNPKDATNIELLDTDSTHDAPFAKQEFANKKGAKSKEQAKAEATGRGQCVKGGRKAFQYVVDVWVCCSRKGMMEKHKGKCQKANHIEFGAIELNC
jgi:hypothetical protein